MKVSTIVKWIDKNAFLVVLIVMLITILLLTGMFIYYGENVTRDPCSLCAKRLGETIVCSNLIRISPEYKYFYPNGTIWLMK